MNKVILPKKKAVTIFLVFALGYYISNLLRAITATIDKVEDLGNYKLLTAKVGNLIIKSKINREIEVPSDSVKLHIPAERCCVYEDEKLI